MKNICINMEFNNKQIIEDILSQDLTEIKSAEEFINGKSNQITVYAKSFVAVISAYLGVLFLFTSVFSLLNILIISLQPAEHIGSFIFSFPLFVALSSLFLLISFIANKSSYKNSPFEYKKIHGNYRDYYELTSKLINPRYIPQFSFKCITEEENIVLKLVKQDNNIKETLKSKSFHYKDLEEATEYKVELIEEKDHLNKAARDQYLNKQLKTIQAKDLKNQLLHSCS